jgi:hypothetical protein
MRLELYNKNHIDVSVNEMKEIEAVLSESMLKRKTVINLNAKVLEYTTKLIVNGTRMSNISRKLLFREEGTNDKTELLDFFEKAISFRNTVDILSLIPKGDLEQNDCVKTALTDEDITVKYFGIVSNDELFGKNLTLLDFIEFKGENMRTVSNWLKFSYSDKILFVAQKPLKHFVSRNDLKNKNLIYGETQIEIRFIKYKVSLLSGGIIPPKSLFQNNEWNDLMYGIHQEKNIYAWDINMTDKDLVVGNKEIGSATWCQEDISFFGISRGQNGIEDFKKIISDENYEDCSWRPVLRVI